MRIFRQSRSDRGSALVLVILLTLILSAFAIVALRNVSRSVQQTALFRTRAQAQTTSSAAVNLYSQRAGDKAATIVQAIKSKARSEGGGESGVYGGSFDSDARLATATAGGHLRVDDDFLDSLIPQSTVMTSSGLEQTGLFTDSVGTRRTFEDSRSSRFEVIVRDLLDGIPAPGYSGRYCFKKALIASDARVGERDDDWTSANNVAYARHGKEVLLGPIECGFE